MGSKLMGTVSPKVISWAHERWDIALGTAILGIVAIALAVVAATSPPAPSMYVMPDESEQQSCQG